MSFRFLAQRCWNVSTVASRVTTTTSLTPLVSHGPSPLTAAAGQIRTLASKKHKNLLKHAKGYRGKSKNCFSIAIRRVHKAWQYAYRDRKVKKRRWRSLWILRLNAAVRQYQWNYSTFMSSLGHNGIVLNRKVLSELAANEPFAFKSVVDVLDQQPLQQQKL